MNSRVFIVLLTFQMAVAAAATPAGPTRLERLALDPVVRVIREEPVGTLDSSDAKLQIFVVELQPVEPNAASVAGVRLDMADNSGADHVYLDGVELIALRKALNGIELGIPLLESEKSAPYRVHGTKNCWMPPERVRILCPDYYIGPDWRGLRARPMGGTLFSFPDRKPGDLMQLIDVAVEKLNSNAPDQVQLIDVAVEKLNSNVPDQVPEQGVRGQN